MCRYFKKKPIWPALSSGSKKMGRSPFHSLRSFHYERPIFPLLLTQLLQKQRYTTDPSPGGNLTRWISTPFTAHSFLDHNGDDLDLS